MDINNHCKLVQGLLPSKMLLAKAQAWHKSSVPWNSNRINLPCTEYSRVLPYRNWILLQSLTHTVMFVRSACCGCLGSKAATEQPSPHCRAVETCREMFSSYQKLWFINCGVSTCSWRNRVACWARQTHERSRVSEAGWGTLSAAPTITRGSWEHNPLLSLLWLQAGMGALQGAMGKHSGNVLCADLGWRRILHQFLLWGQVKTTASTHPPIPASLELCPTGSAHTGGPREGCGKQRSLMPRGSVSCSWRNLDNHPQTWLGFKGWSMINWGWPSAHPQFSFS